MDIAASVIISIGQAEHETPDLRHGLGRIDGNDFIRFVPGL
jgi:hypothetical protein